LIGSRSSHQTKIEVVSAANEACYLLFRNSLNKCFTALKRYSVFRNKNIVLSSIVSAVEAQKSVKPHQLTVSSQHYQ
jgi:hypothetical protein